MPNERSYAHIHESLKHCNNLAGFLKKRQQIEFAYASELFELCQSFNRSFFESSSRPPTVVRPPSILHADPKNSSDLLDAMAPDTTLLRQSVWKAVVEAMEHMTRMSESHKALGISIQQNLIDPFQIKIKDMEEQIRVHQEESVKLTKRLQDVFSIVQKAQHDYDELKCLADEARDNLSKAQLNSSTKKKDLEKLSLKYRQAEEKASQALENFNKCQAACNSAQEDHYNRLLPSLNGEIRKGEEDRMTAIRKLLLDLNFLDKIQSDACMTTIEGLSDRLSTVDVDKDVKQFVESCLADGKDSLNMGVRNLVNPLKAGRVFVKKGDHTPGWVPSYLVLLEKEKRLYCFDRVDSERPREIVSTSKLKIYSVDDSYFGRANCFQIIIDDISPSALSDKSESAPGSSPAATVARQTYNIISESQNDKLEWITHLRRLSYCCPRCAQVYDQTDPDIDPKGGYAMHSADGTTTPVASHSRQASMSEGSGDPQSAPVATAKALTGYARSLQLWITEAKDMGGAQKYAPYCVVLLNDIKQARTTTKHGDSPFWGEDFRFSDIPPCRTRLRLLFFSSSTNRSQKDTEIGYISINLSNLKSGKQVESWYPLKAFSRQATEGDGTPPAAASPGMVRVAYFLTNEKTLPMNAYEEFLQIAMEPKLTCIKHLSKLLGKDKEDFAKTLVSILVAYNRDIEGIQELMSEEIMATANSNIIFRGNSVAIKSLDQYMKMIGSEYLEGTLGSLIRGVYNSKDNCEVDPTKLGQLRSKNVEEVIRKNSKRLLNHVNIFWVTIARSAEKCPPELLSIFARIKDVVSKKFPEDPNAIYSAVSGFIFLRFFCPTILSPKLFGIMSEHPDPITSRTLTLIAKIIQNLANLSEFEGKEPHMGCFNPFIVEHIQSMKAFINTLSRGPVDIQPSTKPRINLRRETFLLYQYFSTYSSEIKKIEEPLIDKLLPIVEQLDKIQNLAQAEEVGNSNAETDDEDLVMAPHHSAPSEGAPAPLSGHLMEESVSSKSPAQWGKKVLRSMSSTNNSQKEHLLADEVGSYQRPSALGNESASAAQGEVLSSSLLSSSDLMGVPKRTDTTEKHARTSKALLNRDKSRSIPVNSPPTSGESYLPHNPSKLGSFDSLNHEPDSPSKSEESKTKRFFKALMGKKSKDKHDADAGGGYQRKLSEDSTGGSTGGSMGGSMAGSSSIIKLAEDDIPESSIQGSVQSLNIDKRASMDSLEEELKQQKRGSRFHFGSGNLRQLGRAKSSSDTPQSKLPSRRRDSDIISSDNPDENSGSFLQIGHHEPLKSDDGSVGKHRSRQRRFKGPLQAVHGESMIQGGTTPDPMSFLGGLND